MTSLQSDEVFNTRSSLNGSHAGDTVYIAAWHLVSTTVIIYFYRDQPGIEYAHLYQSSLG